MNNYSGVIFIRNKYAQNHKHIFEIPRSFYYTKCYKKLMEVRKEMKIHVELVDLKNHKIG